MRRLRLVIDLLRLPTFAVLLLIAALGNLSAIVGAFPQAHSAGDSLSKSEWIGPVIVWLAQPGPPNWLFAALVLILIVLFETAYSKLRVYYWLRPKIALSARADSIRTADGTDLIARLAARNNADQAITDCYATLETATNLYGVQLTPTIRIRNIRLRWQEHEQSDDECRIALPAGSASRSICVADTTDGFSFSACKPSPSEKGMPGIYLIRIRVNGKLRGKAIEPHYFDGYLYVEDGTSMKMIFAAGDWNKDKRIPKPQPHKEGKKKA